MCDLDFGQAYVRDDKDANTRKQGGHRITTFQYVSKEASVGPVFHPGTRLQVLPVLRNGADHSAPWEGSAWFRASAMLLHIHLNSVKLPGRDTHRRTDTQAHVRRPVCILCGPYLRLLEGFKALPRKGVQPPRVPPPTRTVIARHFLHPRSQRVCARRPVFSG